MSSANLSRFLSPFLNNFPSTRHIQQIQISKNRYAFKALNKNFIHEKIFRKFANLAVTLMITAVY